MKGADISVMMMVAAGADVESVWNRASGISFRRRLPPPPHGPVNNTFFTSTFSPTSIRLDCTSGPRPLGALFIFILFPSHLFPEFEGRLATPGILPEHLNRGRITKFLSLRPPIPILVRY